MATKGSKMSKDRYEIHELHIGKAVDVVANLGRDAKKGIVIRGIREDDEERGRYQVNIEWDYWIPAKDLRRPAEEEWDIDILTCVYCGMSYPAGTPPHGSDILTAHIRICEKHPMRKAEFDIKRLRAALLRLLAVEEEYQLKPLMAIFVGILTAPTTSVDDQISTEAAINAIITLLDTQGS